MDLAPVVEKFACDGRLRSAIPYGSGHINDTYCVSCDHAPGVRRYILQRINSNVFPDPEQVMQNIGRVTRHMRTTLSDEGCADIDRRALTLIQTIDGKDFYRDPEGEFWRMYIFIEDAETFDALETTQQAYEAAKAFGDFQVRMTSLPGDPLHETIPNFHNTRARFNHLQDAIHRDPCNRAAHVADEISFVEAREPMVDELVDLQSQNAIPVLTTHNDTKLNNVMLDIRSGKSVCVIDLDTVMPGAALYDFGDMARSAMRPCMEDERDLTRVTPQMDVFEALAHGYIAGTRGALAAAELARLPFSARLMTLEVGIRFLADYILGDTYFKTHRPQHNLDRARVQLTMVHGLEELDDSMSTCVAGL